MSRQLLKEILKSPLSEWSNEKLLQLASNELEALCLVLGIAKSGNRKTRLNRLASTIKIRLIVDAYKEPQSLANAFKSVELKAMCRELKIFIGSTKYCLASTLLNWRNQCIASGKDSIAEIKKYIQSQREEKSMLKLRQRFFEAFEASYSFAKDLYQYMGKNKQHWQVSDALKGMQIIMQDLRLIWQYDADDNRYITFITRSINRINILLQRLQSGKIKELLTELYNQLFELLPSGVNIQLTLFDFHAAFGFPSSSSFATLRPFDFIKEFLRNATWGSPSSLFKSYQGRQLTLPSGQVQ